VSDEVTDDSSTEFQLAQGVFDGQAFTSLIGARLLRFEPGVAAIEVPHRPDLLQQHGFLHGGVVAYAIDNAITFAAGTVLGTSILTAGISVVYLRPASADITATATVVGRTKRQAVVNCEVRCVDPEGVHILVATGQGTAAIVER
jgi:uncharacterized protein (TIGR00369 family)